jgi:hypothetical protein
MEECVWLSWCDPFGAYLETEILSAQQFIHLRAVRHGRLRAEDRGGQSARRTRKRTDSNKVFSSANATPSAAVKASPAAVVSTA